MSFRDRIAEGTPLRLGEFARLIGYSREQVRKLVACDAIQTVSLPGTKERRVPPAEAEKIGRALKLLD